MSNSPTIGGTITGGIQDISALLPLLGTEQCEKHVGSTLDGGFLYASVTPISVFGSLGIVRASFNILVASLSIPRYQFLGARVLSDSGFSLSGTVAPMIALDPKRKRFLAESKLEAMLADEHIDNVADLTVSWAKGTIRWNIMLVASTLVISSAGLLPYVGVILHTDDSNPKPFFPLGFGFPILRVFGSAICVIFAQFLIQIRILVLMKTRLLFIGINGLAKEDHVPDLASEINGGLVREKANERWNSEVAAERCIWVLKKWLDTRSSNIERGDSHRKIKTIYDSEYAKYSETTAAHIHPWITLFLCFGLAIGCIATIVGYIGSFFLIQHSASSNGPLVWLLLEAILSVVRILVWASNPSWDDSKGIEFGFRLSPNPPMLTCNRTVEDMLGRRVSVCITQHQINLEEAVAYGGPLPIFSVQDVQFYYIFAINSRDSTSRRLLIVISSSKEQRSRLLVKEAADRPFSIYPCSLVPFPGTPLMSIEFFTRTQPNSHFLTSHPVFMAELEAHYDKLNLDLQSPESTEDRMAIFEKTWAMQRPLTETAINNELPDMEPIKPPILTEGDKAYLDYHQLEKRWVTLNDAVEQLIQSQIQVYRTRLRLPHDSMLSADQPARNGEANLFLQQHEAIEKAYLLIECQLYFERSLICIYSKWDIIVQTNHANMVEIILKSFLGKTAKSPPGISSTRKRHGIDIRKHKLENRLSAELDFFLGTRNTDRETHAESRLRQNLVSVVESQNPPSQDQLQVANRLEAVWQETGLYYANVSLWHANLAGVLKLPPELGASFNAASALEQCRMLVQIQKNNFIGEMEKRFSNRHLESNDELKEIIDQVRARCQLRAHQLFEMLTPSETTGFQHLIDLPESTLSGSPNLADNIPSSQAAQFLGEVYQEWGKRLQQSEEELVRMGAGPEAKRVAQTNPSR